MSTPRTVAAPLGWALLACSFLAATSNRAAAPPRPGVCFHDDFTANTLQSYLGAEGVRWQAGRAVFANEGTLIRRLPLGGRAELHATVLIRNGAKERYVSLGLTSRSRDGKPISSDFLLRVNPKVGCTDLVGSLGGGPNVRLFPLLHPVCVGDHGQMLAAEETSWEVAVQLRYGLARAKAWRSGVAEPKEWQLCCYSGTTLWEPSAVVVVGSEGTALTRLLVRGDRQGPVPAGNELREQLRKADLFNAKLAASAKLRQEGRFPEAAALVQEAARLRRQIDPDDHPRTARALAILARALVAAKRDDEARPLLEQALSLSRTLFGPEHPDTAAAARGLGDWWERSGDRRRARSYLDEADRIKAALEADEDKKRPRWRVSASDDFARDTLEGYQVAEGVRWEPSRVRFVSDGGMLVRRFPLGPVVEVRATVLVQNDDSSQGVFLGLEGRGSRVRLGLLSEKRGVASMPFLVAVVPGERETRRVPLLGALVMPQPEFARWKAAREHRWEVVVQLRYGLARAKAWRSGAAEPKEWQLTAYSGSVAWEPRSLVVSGKGAVSVAALRFDGEAPTPRLGQEPSQQEQLAARKLEESAGLRREGRFLEAVARAREAVDLRRSLYPAAHPAAALAGEALGQALLAAGEPSKAQEVLDQALGICQQTVGPDHPDTAAVLRTLAEARFAVGDVAGQLERLAEADRISMGLLDHTETVLRAVYAHNFGVEATRRGELALARRYLDTALSLNRAAHGSNSIEVGEGLLALGNLCFAIGEYAEAQTHFAQALALQVEHRGKAHRNTAVVLTSLGETLWKQGDLPKAKEYLEKALEVATGLRTEAELVCRGKAALGLVLIDSAAVLAYPEKPSPDAEACRRGLRYLQEVVASRRQTGSLKRGLAGDLNSLGLAYQLVGDLVRARRAFAESLAMAEQALGKDHANTATARMALAGVCQLAGDDQAALPLLEKALASQLEEAWRTMPSLSEAEARAFLRRLGLARDPLLSIWRNDPEANAAEAYAAVWRTRALSLRTLADRRSVAADPRARDIREELRRTSAALSAWSWRMPGQEGTAVWEQTLSRLSKDKERLQRALAERLVQNPERQADARVTFTDLARRLPEGVAVVDLVRVHPVDATPARSGFLAGGDRYDAFVLRRERGAPGYQLAWVPLGEAGPIDHAVGQWRDELSRSSGRGGRPQQRSAGAEGDEPPSDRRSPAARLRSLVWGKVEGHLGGCQTVFVIPDGALGLVPWAALPGQERDTYLVHKYAIATVPHGQSLYQSLAGKKSEVTKPLACLIVGAVDYDVYPWLAGLVASSPPGPLQTVPWLRMQPPYLPLSWSLLEVATVRGGWPGEKVEVVTGRDATVQALRTWMPRSRHIHLGSHGEFNGWTLPGGADAAPGRAGRKRKAGLAPEGIGGRNLLLLSGLILAGANRAWLTREGGGYEHDTGVLTAEVVAEEDLGGTQTVVLSACETGLGVALEGDPLRGMQLAFHLAGARTVIASLWAVDDRLTSELMGNFYLHLRGVGLGPLQAMREAQLQYLSSRHRQFGEKDPVYWAAWTVSGDPGTIPVPIGPERAIPESGAVREPRAEENSWISCAAWALPAAGILVAGVVWVWSSRRSRSSLLRERP